MQTNQQKTNAALASIFLSRRKRATVRDIEADFRQNDASPEAAYGSLRRLAKYGFAEKTDGDRYEHVTTLTPRQDRLIRVTERRRKARAGARH